MSASRQLNDTVEPLVSRAQAGDDVAFRRLVDRCHRSVHRWALGITGDPDDADDVAQEVFVSLHWNLRRYQGRSRFTTWLYRITHNAATALQRRRARRARLAWEHRREDGPHGVPDNRLERLDASHVAELVRALWTQLPPRQREVFDLVDLQGFTPAEAAEMLDMKRETARAHLFKARRTLRTRILARHPEIAQEYAR